MFDKACGETFVIELCLIIVSENNKGFSVLLSFEFLLFCDTLAFNTVGSDIVSAFSWIRDFSSEGFPVEYFSEIFALLRHK